MKKASILCIAVLLICLAAIFNFDRIQMWIPTDFSATEAEVEAHTAKQEVRYYYDSLSLDGKVAYNHILAQIRTHPEEIEIPPLKEEDFHQMFQALSYDNPDLLCMQNESQIVTRGAKAFFVPQYVCDVQTCNEHTDALHAAVQDILRALPATADTFTLELYLHDAVCARMAYETQDSGVGYNAYDALVLGKAVCEGYSRALQLLFNCVGIQNYLVTGTGVNADGDTEGHMWNLVRIDGQNYYVDATWDDLDSVSINRYSHTYFNVADADVQTNHLDMSPAANRCIYEQYNYFVYQKLLFKQYDSDARARITECISNALQNGETTFEIRFSNRAVFEEAFADLIENGTVYDLAQKADRRFLKKYSNIMFVQDEQMLTVQFSFV